MVERSEPLITENEDRETRHLTVLQEVIENDPIDDATLSGNTGYSRREVRSSFTTLENEGLVEVTSRGAETTDAVEGFLDDVDEDLPEYIQKLERGDIEYGEESTSIFDRIRNLVGG